MESTSKWSRSILFLLNLTSFALAAGTNFLNTNQLLSDVEDPAWFASNIPIIDLPDQQIQDVYYYRWQTYKEHLTYTGAQYGWLSTEFLETVDYAGPFGAINSATGHHIREGRWLRDKGYGQSLVNFWLSGPGTFPQSRTEPGASWSVQYSFWAASAVWWQYLVTGDKDFVVSQLDNLKAQYSRWDDHYNQTLGLYWQFPVWDATEYSLASYASPDPFFGGAGYRPTINAYQFGDAVAISAIARLAGDTNTSTIFSAKATALQTKLQDQLWDDEQQFFEHMARDDNPGDDLLGAREIMGYVPWMFGMPLTNETEYSSAFAQLLDTAGFDSPYGPLTAENRSSGFMKDAYTGCCHWDGPSWPFATSQTLMAVETLLNDYPSTSVITSADYATMVQKYAATQYRNGLPYVAEAHDPYADNWIYDAEDHSEDYNHSTFVDIIIGGLLGLRPQDNENLIINPLVSSSWKYFAIENAPYHGHNITVIWDSDGSRYNQGAGFKVFVDATQVISQGNIGKVTIQVGSTTGSTTSNLVNIAANRLLFQSGTQVSASYAFSDGEDNATHVIDGSILRVGIPENSRWTSYKSNNPTDWIAIDLRRPQTLSNVVLYFYDDDDGVRIPSNYSLEYLDGTQWVAVPGQQSDNEPAANAAVSITFPDLSASQLRVTAPNVGDGVGWGLSEFQVWTQPIFAISNVNSGLVMGVEDASTTDGALVQQFDNDGDAEHKWEMIILNSGWVKIKNLNSGQLLTVQNNATTNSANLIQSADIGSDAQLWRVQDWASNGQFFIFNKNSGLVAGVDSESEAIGAQIVQYENSGTSDHLWELLPYTSGSPGGTSGQSNLEYC